ncbi:MAG TPA: general secretion pathway protein GspB [Solimonas sp.]|nr:general secretion pathway protein GspB [Solimonas sp.]
MSYILDALRKAEQERKLGQPPSLQAVMHHLPADDPAPRRRLLLLAVIIAALMLLAVTATLLWQRRQAPPPANATPVTTAPTVAETPAVATAEAIPPAPVATDIASLDDLAAPEEPEPVVEAQTASEPVRSRPAVVPAQEVLSEAEVAAEPEMEAPQHQPETSTASDAVPMLRDLPPEVRANFPQLSVEVHVYDHDPAKRWIMVGGRRYREGEALSEGPQISEITAEGIVLDSRGQRALVPITR